jgi:hypothetical protein
LRTHGVKGNQKVALVGRLYRQYRTPSVMVLQMSLTGILALRIATLLNSARACSNRTHDAVRIARATRSRAPITLTSDIEVVA